MGVDVEDEFVREDQPEIDLCAQTIKEFVEHAYFENFILTTIVVNGIVMVRSPSRPMLVGRCSGAIGALLSTHSRLCCFARRVRVCIHLEDVMYIHFVQCRTGGRRARARTRLRGRICELLVS